MNLKALFAAALLLSTPLAASAEEACRFIDKRAERDACYARQDEARVAKLKAQDEAKRAATYAPPPVEDQAMFQTLHSICRGC